MSLLNFNHSHDSVPKNLKSLKLIFGIGALVGSLAIGSTLAANINLNSGGNVEFGQGVVQTVACDDQITITPYSTFENAAGAGSFLFTSLEISGIDSSANKCSGKTFVIKAYGDSGQLDLFNYTGPSENTNYNAIEIANEAGAFSWISGGDDGDDVIPGPSGDLTQTSFTLKFTSASDVTRTALASAEDVTRITVESKDSIQVTPAAYAIGDTGPGGGKVFFVKSTGAFSYTFVSNQRDIDDYRNNPGMYADWCTEFGVYCEEPAPQYETISLTSEEQAALDFDYLEFFSMGNGWYGTWGSNGFVAGGVGSKIGTGKINTQNIAATFTSDSSDNNAAKYVDAFSVNGFEDWFLPSSDELHLILRLAIESNSGGPDFGSFPYPYWASTYNTDANARLNGIQGAYTFPDWQGRGYGFGRVIAVRSF